MQGAKEPNFGDPEHAFVKMSPQKCLFIEDYQPINKEGSIEVQVYFSVTNEIVD